MPVRLSDVFPLVSARYHEVTGTGAFSFASICCGTTTGMTLWFVERWVREGINPMGLQRYCDPHRVLIGKCNDAADVLAATEPLSLTAGRRLQLAAEAGAATGLMIVRDGMGSNATQTRWQVSPVFSPDDSTQMRWSLNKNKSGTKMNWDIRWDEKARRVSVVSEDVQRIGSSQAAS